LPQAILKPQIPAAIFSSRHRRMMRERECVCGQKTTKPAQGNNSSQRQQHKRRGRRRPKSKKKVPFGREREEEESTGRVLTPLPPPPFFFWLNLVSWLNVFFEMAKNIYVFFGFV